MIGFIFKIIKKFFSLFSFCFCGCFKTKTKKEIEKPLIINDDMTLKELFEENTNTSEKEKIPIKNDMATIYKTFALKKIRYQSYVNAMTNNEYCKMCEQKKNLNEGDIFCGDCIKYYGLDNIKPY